MKVSRCLNSSGADTGEDQEGERQLPKSADAYRMGLSGLVSSAAKLVQHRFFIIAGAFPYALGAAVGYEVTGEMDWRLLLLGLIGVVFVSLGIEGMNEYFDSIKGGDRVFSSSRRIRIWWHLPLGIAGFTLALAVAAYLVTLRGWGVLVFALCGGGVAFSYLMPPINLSYRGLGETVIAIAYGPGLTLGSFYLQTGRVSWVPVLVSGVPGLAMFAVALANEVPDYYGDRLVGKRNLIVRLGPRNGVLLYGLVLIFWFGLILAGLLSGAFPLALGLCFVFVPLAFRNVRHGLKYCTSPVRCGSVISTTILVFVVANTVAIASYVFGRAF